MTVSTVVTISSQYRRASGVDPRAEWLSPGRPDGRNAAMTTIASAPNPLNTRNAARQPNCSPSQVPTGTPTTAASELPADTTAMLRPVTLGENNPAAVGTATDQNKAWLNAMPIRAASNTQ
jgi:hypothetical protein